MTHGILASNLRYYAQDFGGGTALLEFVQSTLEAAKKLPSLQFERDGWVKSFQVETQVGVDPRSPCFNVEMMLG